MESGFHIHPILPERSVGKALGLSSERHPYLWENGWVKTTVEIPDAILRRAKAAAAEEGISLKDFFTEAIGDRLHKSGEMPKGAEPWRVAFGQLKHLHRETKRIEKIIEEEFEQIEEDEWR
jgi:hypothetical protein